MAADEEIRNDRNLKRGLFHIQEAALHLADAAMFLHFGGYREVADECEVLVRALREILRRGGTSLH